MPPSTPPPAFTLHTSFSPLLSLYDTFLLDQFGVIHNGAQSLHGAVECIEAMVARKKKLAILSNTSSPSHVAIKRLTKYGLRGDLFEGGLVSSGEECAKYVRETYCGGGSSNPKKALWLTWQESEKQNPPEFLSHCEIGSGGEIQIASSIQDADFILLHGSEVWRKSREAIPDRIQDLNFLYDEDYTVIDPILDQCVERELPMICANPDLIVGLPGDVVGNMPGKIAARYSSKGGAVRHFGKPNPRHFLACLENLGHTLDENAKFIPDVAHVGDSIEHDVAGANAAGIDSVFVMGGIHAKELGLVPTGSEKGDTVCINESDLNKKLKSFFDEREVWPTHVVPSLSLDGVALQR